MVIPFHFAQLSYLFVAAVFLVLLMFYRLFFYKPTLYQYSLVNFIAEKRLFASQIPVHFFFLMRLIILSLMVILIGKPQLVDVKSKMTLNGIDIVLALDVSGSMALFDDLNDRRTRLEVAKQEALNFIDKRTNDAIGIVIFGRYALARCPITLDKSILKTVISDLQIGQPSQDMQMMTMLSQGLVTAARRLQGSKATSKIIVLLTDGAPSPGDLSSDDAINIAKEIGIKIYTIGIGDDLGGYANDSVFGIQRHQTPLNKKLLKKIANDTGGQFFEAKNPKDLAYIYDKIDKLEKNEIQSDIYHNYQDYFMPILWAIVLIAFFELFVATFVWFIL
jgi:Ca-activated chloride channel family protein